jgi:hypothetical protein
VFAKVKLRYGSERLISTLRTYCQFYLHMIVTLGCVSWFWTHFSPQNSFDSVVQICDLLPYHRCVRYWHFFRAMCLAVRQKPHYYLHAPPHFVQSRA